MDAGEQPLLTGDGAAKPGERGALLFGEGGADFVFVLARNLRELLEKAEAFLRQDEARVTSILGIALAVDQVPFAKLVKQSDHLAGEQPHSPGQHLLIACGAWEMMRRMPAWRGEMPSAFTRAAKRSAACAFESPAVRFAIRYGSFSAFQHEQALLLLVLHGMNLTLDEIASHRTRLRQEIMERECLLAAFDVVEKYAARGHAPHSMELGSLVAALLPSRPTVELKELPASPAPPAPVALAPKPPVERYMHPELKAIRYDLHGGNGRRVTWAIQRMTEDYSLRDIAAVLEREGAPMRFPEISVVLTRLKARGEIEEIRPSAGPHPALFRKPESAPSLSVASEDSVANTETTTTSATVL